jgi:transglutaminase-like putative cysteine protease
MSRRDIRADTEVVGGRTIQTHLSRSSMSNMPDVEFTEEFDVNAEVVRTETVLGGIQIETRLADEASALAPIEGGAEVMVSTLVSPSRPIENARHAGRASFLLSVKNGTLPELPETGSQRVERVNPKQARVHIDAHTPIPAAEADLADARFTASSLFCRADDEEIKRLTERATRNAGEDPAARAEAIRRFVHSYLNRKSLDVGFASASETARSRAGDCSEHAVLLAAMLRANGIPARGGLWAGLRG